MNPSLACARAFQRRGIVNCLRAHREPLRSISVINWESTTGGYDKESIPLLRRSTTTGLGERSGARLLLRLVPGDGVSPQRKASPLHAR